MTDLRHLKYLILFSITLLQCFVHQASAADQNYLNADNKEISYDVITNKSEGNKASLAIFFDKGANAESEAEKGFTHCLEHMMFEGTINFPKDSIVQYNKNMGGKMGLNFNAETHANGVTLQIDNITLVNNKIPDAYVIFFSDIINNLTLEETVLEKQKKIIIEELLLGGNRIHQTREDIDNWQCPERRENNSSYILGTKEQIENITKQKISHFYNQWIKDCKIKIVAVGDINQELTTDQIETYFPKIDQKTIFVQSPTHSYQKYDDHPVQIKEFPINTEIFFIDTPLPSIQTNFHNDIELITTLDVIQLLVSIRNKQWVQELSGFYEYLSIEPIVGTSLGLTIRVQYLPKLGKEEEMHKHLLTRLRELLEDGFTSKELRQAKRSYNDILTHQQYQLINKEIL
ncbi:insulinase family protein, partial [Prolixibacteraceae bacterium]|nr:insulinase family protein [Prolixibacteraceae bacterium]